uniref:NADH-ubiquinone oxidoreductase chain 2 n=1 Tax=Alloeorhynchus bakeri TaxID=796621 RepID=G9B4I3_9HEMI|nr:NADH dehydrogenase subunit 2 [Alloeorhynchus bakeri]ADI75219.1 NADH dehydrogenase subunit 2 [Alloeorhynchus bakeri]
MKYSSKMLFMFTLIISTFMVISSSNWMSMWMGLEINLMAFSPLISKAKNTPMSESCMMYFLVQVLGSALFLLSITHNMMNMNWMMTMNWTTTIMTLSILIKTGTPPFHMWVPMTMEKMSWNNCLLLMTWQKIAPMFILTNITKYSLFPMIIIMAVWVGAIGGLNQSSLRKMMAYSSMNHTGWMLACIMMSNNLWMIYISIYSINTLMMIYFFKKENLFFINQVPSKNLTLIMKMNLIMIFMSMGGLPPFLGFMPKWMVINLMMNMNTFLTTFIMVMMSLITLFYYIRIVAPLIIMNSSSSKWKSPVKNSLLMPIIFMMLTSFMLPIMYLLNM